MDKQARRELVGVAVNVALVEAVAHWFPWPKLLGDEMRPPATYVAGMAPILGGFAAWALRRRTLAGRDAVAGIGLITILAGVAVCACYAIDNGLGATAQQVARGILWSRMGEGSSCGRS